MKQEIIKIENENKIKQLFEEIENLYGKHPIPEKADTVKAFNEWVEALAKNYSLEKLLDVLRTMYRYDKRASVPKIAHFMAYLKNEDKLIQEEKDVKLNVTTIISYTEARKWYDKYIGNHTIWNTDDKVVFYQDVNYAFSIAMREWKNNNGAMISKYSEDGLRITENDYLTLFYLSEDSDKARNKKIHNNLKYHKAKKPTSEEMKQIDFSKVFKKMPK